MDRQGIDIRMSSLRGIIVGNADVVSWSNCLGCQHRNSLQIFIVCLCCIDVDQPDIDIRGEWTTNLYQDAQFDILDLSVEDEMYMYIR